MSLSLTVLGSAGSHPGVARACSGYLVRAGDTAVLLDAGNGSTANLQRYLPFTALDAVVVSHRHVDHCADLVGAFYALKYGRQRAAPLTIHGAAEVGDALTRWLDADSEHEFSDVFDVRDVAGGDEVTIGALALRFADSVHPVPAVSTRITHGDRTIVYSGDSAGGDDLVEIARGADLFLCEASWTGDIADYRAGIHLTATSAAEIAAEAGVGRLVLTHITGAADRPTILREARAVFDGPVELAEDLTTYILD